MSTPAFTRLASIAILSGIGLCFATGHIAARLSFDLGTGVIATVFFRSALVGTILTFFLLHRRQRFTLAPELRLWQLLLGVLITIQSIGLYIGVANIPVGIALLFVHTFAIMLALITWALGGPAPRRSSVLLMLLCLFGLFLCLDVPQLLSANAADRDTWVKGVSAALIAALAFAFGMWVTEHKLPTLAGSLRSFYTTLVILACVLGISRTDGFADGFQWPPEPIGWAYLVFLSSLYGLGFITLFVLAPRLNMAQNSPALHIEPVVSLALGWVILGQRLSTLQIIGGFCVIIGIMTLALLRRQEVSPQSAKPATGTPEQADNT